MGVICDVGVVSFGARGNSGQGIGSGKEYFLSNFSWVFPCMGHAFTRSHRQYENYS